MKILKKIYYHDLEKLKETIKVEKIYCLPVFGEGLTEEEIEKIDMKNFIFPWKRNWDWYFTEKINDKRLEKYTNVYFSKEPLEECLYEYVDYLQDVELYMFVKVWEKNWILKDPVDYFKLYLEP